MAENPKSERKINRIPTHYFRLAVFCALLAALTSAAAYELRPHNHLPATRSPSVQTLQPVSAAPLAYSPASQPVARPLLPYSIIPGGVQSIEELRTAIARDPLVAQHYAGFDLSKARIVRLDTAREAYVSYRLNGHVYWTNRKLTLAKGETVVTDGNNDARTRCGNRLAYSAQAPVSPLQPPARVFDGIAPELDPIAMAFPEYVPAKFAGPVSPTTGSLPPSIGILLPPLLPVGGPGGGAPSSFEGGNGPSGPATPGSPSIPGSPGSPGSPSSPSSPSSPGAPSGPGTPPSGPSGPGGPSGPPSGPSGPQPPSVVTPEPNTALLTATGFVGLFLMAGYVRRKRTRA